MAKTDPRDDSSEISFVGETVDAHNQFQSKADQVTDVLAGRSGKPLDEVLPRELPGKDQKITKAQLASMYMEDVWALVRNGRLRFSTAQLKRQLDRIEDQKSMYRILPLAALLLVLYLVAGFLFNPSRLHYHVNTVASGPFLELVDGCRIADGPQFTFDQGALFSCLESSVVPSFMKGSLGAFSGGYFLAGGLRLERVDQKVSCASAPEEMSTFVKSHPGFYRGNNAFLDACGSSVVADLTIYPTKEFSTGQLALRNETLLWLDTLSDQFSSTQSQLAFAKEAEWASAVLTEAVKIDAIIVNPNVNTITWIQTKFTIDPATNYVEQSVKPLTVTVKSAAEQGQVTAVIVVFVFCFIIVAVFLGLRIRGRGLQAVSGNTIFLEIASFMLTVAVLTGTLITTQAVGSVPIFKMLNASQTGRTVHSIASYMGQYPANLQNPDLQDSALPIEKIYKELTTIMGTAETYQTLFFVGSVLLALRVLIAMTPSARLGLIPLTLRRVADKVGISATVGVGFAASLVSLIETPPTLFSHQLTRKLRRLAIRFASSYSSLDDHAAPGIFCASY